MINLKSSTPTFILEPQFIRYKILYTILQTYEAQF